MVYVPRGAFIHIWLMVPEPSRPGQSAARNARAKVGRPSQIFLAAFVACLIAAASAMAAGSPSPDPVPTSPNPDPAPVPAPDTAPSKPKPQPKPQPVHHTPAPA